MGWIGLYKCYPSAGVAAKGCPGGFELARGLRDPCERESTLNYSCPPRKAGEAKSENWRLLGKGSHPKGVGVTVDLSNSCPIYLVGSLAVDANKHCTWAV